MLIFYFYAIIGLELFGNIKKEKVDQDFNIFNDYANFETFGNTLLLLLQVFINIGWSYFIYNFRSRKENYIMLSIYLITFNLITIIILINLIKGKHFFQNY